jgi:hypothetical protein
MAEGIGPGKPAARKWSGYTPAGHLLVVERDRDMWLVTRDGDKPVGHHLLDVALISAVRGDVQAHWNGIEPARWTRLIADSILLTWPKQE